ncbi:MAG TPA: glycosidase, partial [bacterium]|nr:glycosidase [bacterium]
YEDSSNVIYQSSISWDDKWFMLDGFYRTGHLHWKYEGDFFGLYRDAYYGENVDIYEGIAPVGFEIAAKRQLDGLKVAFGPQLWWGANPAVLVKYNRQIGDIDATAVYHEDISEQSSVSSSIAIPEPKTKKLSLQVATKRGPWGIELGGIWSGSTKVGEKFQIAEETSGGYDVFEDEIVDSDALGVKAKVTWEKGRWHWYGQGARMGLVADAGPDPTTTFTGWHLKDTGSGNQTNFLTGLAVNVGNFQFGPNFLWQKPIVGPVPSDVPTPGRPRNILSDPFAVRWNREAVGGEFVITYDPTPATWFWQWDNNVRENAPLAASLGFVYMHLPTTMDVTNFIAEDGVTVYSFAASPPPKDMWELGARLVSKLGPETRVVSGYWYGRAQPNGYDPSGANLSLNRTIEMYGTSTRLTHGPLAVEGSVEVNGWGPYDYHRDFNLTFPLQVMGDVSYSLGSPRWFGNAQTRIGFRGTWRSLDEHSPRYNPDTAEDGEGSEWELRTYVHVAL